MTMKQIRPIYDLLYEDYIRAKNRTIELKSLLETTTEENQKIINKELYFLKSKRKRLIRSINKLAEYAKVEHNQILKRIK